MKAECRLFAGLAHLAKALDVLTVDEWAAEKRIVVESARAGRWNADFAPYTIAPMRALSDPNIEYVVLQWGAQTGKSEVIMNFLLSFADQDPSPSMFVLPTIQQANEWGGGRLEKTIQAMEELNRVVYDRGKGRTQKMKLYPGGYINLASAGSASELASKPIRYLALDEIDKFPDDVDGEGSPMRLAQIRTTTYEGHGRKILMCSTPSIKGDSAIESAYELGDKQVYELPCPDCGKRFVPTWSEVRWMKVAETREPDYNSIGLACPKCGVLHNDGARIDMIREGRWRKTGGGSPGTASFHLNSICSPWISLAKLVQEWHEAQASVSEMQTFINGRLAETWELQGDGLDEEVLMERASKQWDEECVPERVIALTAGVDVQGDRLECYVGGWDIRGRHYGIAHKIILGGQPHSWDELTEYLFETDWATAAGRSVGMQAVLVDSGYETDTVYQYCSALQDRNVMPCKGSPSRRGKGLIQHVTGISQQKTRLKGHYKQYQVMARSSLRGRPPVVIVDTQAAKDNIAARALLAPEQPNAMMWHRGFTLEWWRQLASEKRVRVRKSGEFTYMWKMKAGHKRNEALDCLVYSMAARRMVLTQTNEKRLEGQRKLWMSERGLDDDTLEQKPDGRRRKKTAKEKEAAAKVAAAKRPAKRRGRLVIRDKRAARGARPPRRMGGLRR